MPANRPTSASSTRSRPNGAGNVQLWGITGVQKEVVLASRRAIVTVEEVVDELEPRPGAFVLPAWVVDAVCAVMPGGAHPSYAHGYYDRDNAFYVGLGRHQPRPGRVRGLDPGARARHGGRAEYNACLRVAVSGVHPTR